MKKENKLTTYFFWLLFIAIVLISIGYVFGKDLYHMLN